ncbi:MAG: hypothetical protein A2Z21_02405 [Candidatus Fraserbacteria bacterium RBG_16_55_9]|uniref:Toxin-antitoxin system protein n=1 Tax=Fraserbacteria sp. (strain RBG_16_55_9) TaxID=1817864 RepID=A0A1F5V1P8_FRAXR|nr:MAG: hypothetical protein A2Z21_02405 [Candidatus Fraserbacteria bacterium RBG_16_55_9]
MPSARISEPLHRALHQLAKKQKTSIKEVLEAAIETYRRQCFLEESNAAFVALRQNPKAWQEEREERAAWDQTLGDRLQED